MVLFGLLRQPPAHPSDSRRLSKQLRHKHLCSAAERVHVHRKEHLRSGLDEQLPVYNPENRSVDTA